MPIMFTWCVDNTRRCVDTTKKTERCCWTAPLHGSDSESPFSARLCVKDNHANIHCANLMFNLVTEQVHRHLTYFFFLSLLVSRNQFFFLILISERNGLPIWSFVCLRICQKENFSRNIPGPSFPLRMRSVPLGPSHARPSNILLYHRTIRTHRMNERVSSWRLKIALIHDYISLLFYTLNLFRRRVSWSATKQIHTVTRKDIQAAMPAGHDP